MLEYEKFDIVEVAEACGIELNSRTLGKAEVEAWCPFCPTESSDYHLYLSKGKGQFYCQKCSASGNSVTLYARFYGISNKEAAGRLRHGEISGAQYNGDFAYLANRRLRAPGYEAAPLARRHDVYYDMLSEMSLTEPHRINLAERGLSRERIRQGMYRSMPEDNYKRRKIAETLSTRHDLRGVPGFYYSKYRHWELAGTPGVLIPICNQDGYIQGLQIRLDDADKKKYRWLSSNPDNGYPYGTASSVWVHVTGDRGGAECDLTEGALKGDVASHLSGGRLFVCTAGVNSIQYLAGMLKALGVKKVNGCYDMDQVTIYYDLVKLRRENPFDKEAAKPCSLERMEAEVRSAGVDYERRIWAPELNGIDKYYLDWFANRQKAG
jgi:hypothetical protein